MSEKQTKEVDTLERYNQYNKIYNTSILDEVYQEHEEGIRLNLRPMVEGVYQYFKNGWIEEVEEHFLNDTKEDFLKLTEEKAKEKLRKILRTYLTTFCNDYFNKSVTIHV